MIAVVVTQYGRNLATAAAVMLERNLRWLGHDVRLYATQATAYPVGHDTDNALRLVSLPQLARSNFSAVFVCGPVPDAFLYDTFDRLRVIVVVTDHAYLEQRPAGLGAAAAVLCFDQLTQEIAADHTEQGPVCFIPFMTALPITGKSPAGAPLRVLFPLAWQLTAQLEITAIDVILRAAQRPGVRVAVMADSRDLTGRARYLLQKNRIAVIKRPRYDRWPLLFNGHDLVACLAVADTVGVMPAVGLTCGSAVLSVDTPVVRSQEMVIHDSLFPGGGHWRYTKSGQVVVTPHYAEFEDKLHGLLDTPERLIEAGDNAAAAMRDSGIAGRAVLHSLVTEDGTGNDQ